MNAARELKPCPFCGGIKVSVTTEMHDGNYAVQCQTCYAGGPQRTSKRRVRIEWNTRDTTATAALTLELETVKRERDVLGVAINQYGRHFRVCLAEAKCTCGLEAFITTPNYKEENDTLRQQLAEARGGFSDLTKRWEERARETDHDEGATDRDNAVALTWENAVTELKATLNPPTDEK